MEWKTSYEGNRYRKFKEGCIEIIRKGDTKPSLLVTENHLIDFIVDMSEPKKCPECGCELDFA